MPQATIRKALENWQHAVSSWRRTTVIAACRDNPCDAHRIIAGSMLSESDEDPEVFDRVCREVRALCRGCQPRSTQTREP